MTSKRSEHNPPRYGDQDGKEGRDNQKSNIKTPSLKTLINWNISKALKSNPGIDLKASLREAQERMEEAHDVTALASPDARNLCCAILAWQQLGHSRTDSLFNFIEQTLNEEKCERQQHEASLCESLSYESHNPEPPKSSSRPPCQWGSPAKMDFSTSIGLVVKLPAEPQTLMHMSGPVRVPNNSKKCGSCKSQGGTASRMDSACCVDTACMQRLTSMEQETVELRKRAAQFARRETQRAEILERAEMAWRDLDMGYQRRLRLAKEKEEEYDKKAAKLLQERNKWKQACMPLVDTLKNKNATADNEQDALTEIEKEVCAAACARMRLADMAARADAQLTEQQCKASQLDRNLAMKEEQERRKQLALAGAAEAAQLLTHEAEYAQRAEVRALREQVEKASKDLLEEDGRTGLLQQRIEDYTQEKDEMIEDLEACQVKCEGRMAELVKDLKSKRDQVADLENKVMECLCKEPVERSVEVKRTPSLAAMCRCSPSETIQGSCSCTSIRTRLLSALLRDLFGGLKSEMETISYQMPCHLLKCLEDKHNWDRTTEVKQNVRAYFSRLLLGELDIAIATVIETCHAQWVGECCADLKKPRLSHDSKHSLRWQEHELEMKTQKMAKDLAEKMFKDKAKELALQAQENLSKGGRPPCECDFSNNGSPYSSAVYRCLVHPYPDCQLEKPKNSPTITSNKVHRKDNPMPQHTQTRLWKKDAVTTPKCSFHPTDKIRRRDAYNIRPPPILKNTGNAASARRISNVTARKLQANTKAMSYKTDPHKTRINNQNKIIKKPQQYAVNMCFCNNKTKTRSKSPKNVDVDSELFHNYKDSVLSLRQQKPIISGLPKRNSFQECGGTSFSLCTEKCTCLNKTPSNTSIERLVSILTKWKDNLDEPQHCNIKEALDTESLFQITHASILNVLQELNGKTDNVERQNSVTKLEKCAVSDNNIKSPEEKKPKALDEEDEISKTIISSQIHVKQSKLLIAIHINDNANKSDDKANNFKSNTTNQLCNMPSAKSLSVKADLQPVSIEKYLPIDENYTRMDSSINKNYNSKIYFADKSPQISLIETSITRVQDGEKGIQWLGATLANAICKLSLNKNSIPEAHHNQISNYQEDTSNNNSINHLVYERKHSKHCYNLNKQNRFQETGDVAQFPPVKRDDDCGNYVQFLGVTLDNVKAKMVSKSAKKQRIHNDSKKHHREMFMDKRQNHHEQSDGDDKLHKLKANRDIRKSRCAIKRVKALNVLHVHNDCVGPRNKVDNLSNQKSIEVENNSIDFSFEPCVCCPISNKDDSDDLEVNAFQLLEEHLQSKLDEFKSSTCKYSCIQKVDERTILGNTLMKVKKIILESANTVTCKCVGNNQSSGGSWNRAYSLLQEYLRTKIEHVKCECSSVEYSPDKNLVSRVLSQINNLIENDLQRLKNICKCKDTFETCNKSKPQFTHDVGVTKKCNNKTIKNVLENDMLTSQVIESESVSYNSSVLLPHNKSAQVLLHRSVETKSCDALKTYNKYSEVQTVDVIETKLVIDDYINTKIANLNVTSKNEVKDDYSNKTENELNLHPTLQSNGFPKDTALFNNRDITVLPIVMSPSDNVQENHSQKSKITVDEQLVDENKLFSLGNGVNQFEKPREPYIGCTINCCCDHDLGCVCTKSLFPSNAEWLKTNNIWKHFSQKQGVVGNISYILKNVPKDANSIEDVTKDYRVTENLHNQNPRDKKNQYIVKNYCNTHFYKINETKLCESEASASQEKHIYLKQSKQQLDIVHGASNTDQTDDCSLQYISILPEMKRQGVLKQNTHGLLKHDPLPLSNSDTTLVTDHTSKRSEFLASDCDCAMVPMCHVKLLMENIGNKLVKAECTCDSIKSVCPMHS